MRFEILKPVLNKLDDYYEKIASGYDLLHGDEQFEKLKIIRSFFKSDLNLKFNSDLILMDIGCGTGISTTVLPCFCVGVDPAIGLLTQANNKRNEISKNKDQKQIPLNNFNHLGYICGIAEALPIKDNSCNIVVSVTAVHNFNDINQGLSELLRITSERSVISILKKAKNFKEIIEIIKTKFQILNTNENNFDYFLYLKPKK